MTNKSAQLKYPGGKAHCAEDLLAFAPSTFTEFRDPCCGNCPFLFHTDVIPTTIPRWINDLDHHLIAYLRALKSEDGFIDHFWKLRSSIIDSAEKSKQAFTRACGIMGRRTDPESYLLTRRLAHRQIVRPVKRSSVASFGYENIGKGLDNVHLDDLHEAREILQGVKITCHDGFKVMTAPTDGVVFMTIDVPYRIEDHKSPLYDHEFTDEQQQQLHDVLASLNPKTHKFLVTIDRTLPSYDLWFHSQHRRSGLFRVFERPNRNGMSSNQERSTKIELLIRNFDG